jgi:3-keto-disaccharide hydrolase
MTTKRRRALVTVMLAFVAATSIHLLAQPVPPPPVIGRWDLTVQGANGSFPSWLEVRLSGNRTLVGQFVGQGGSARPVSRVTYGADGTVKFSLPPQCDKGDADLQFEGKLVGDKLSGSMVDASGGRHEWTGVRAPTLRRTSGKGWGEPVTLFGGTEMTAWKPLGTETNWQVVNGVLTSTKPGANLATVQTFTDFKLHIEFKYGKDGNSGVYLRGRYEVQISDSAGLEPDSHYAGGIYGFLSPNEDAAKPAGEWQAYDITLFGRTVSVNLNNHLVICRQEIPGITGGALDSNEDAPGPIVLQGDHQPIEFRNIVITPAL